MSSLPFVKLQGLGNDFVLFDGLKAPLPPWLGESEVVRQLCDRRFGIGADGLLLVLPGDEASLARMRVLNADGSEPEMCGNGLRCVGHFLLTEGLCQPGATFSVQTGAGVLPCQVKEGTRAGESRIAVEMGRPSLDPADLPMDAKESQIEAALTCAGERFVGTAVGMGNPHFVIFEDDPERDLEDLARRFGPSLEHHPAFPNRVNIEFARITPAGDAVAWVWERGSGLTLACGTGACAVAVAATLTHRVPTAPLRVHLPGGALKIHVAPDLGGVTMRGAAAEVYRGRLETLARGLAAPRRPASA